jgi:hypothetical protein
MKACVQNKEQTHFNKKSGVCGRGNPSNTHQNESWKSKSTQLSAKPALIKYKEIETTQILNGSIEVRIVWDGSMLSISPNNDSAKALGDSICDVDIINQVLQAAVSKLNLNPKDLCEICVIVK